jgi:hypothetical protein
MLRVFLFIMVLTTISRSCFTQTRKVYSLENNDEFDRVFLYLQATSNSCFIRPTSNPDIISLFSPSSNQSEEPSINALLNDRINNVHITYNRPSDFFMSTMTNQLFSRTPDPGNEWDYYLSNQKPMQLNLDYAIGNAEVDLSNLPVERLTIRTGNADVNVGYQEDQPNLVEMDTFFVRVEMGSLRIKRINYSNARNIYADVVFGGLFLNYSCAPEESSVVNASVGAGTLIIDLPKSAEIPVKISIHNSPLCHVSLPKNYHKLNKTVYVNEFYNSASDKILSFELDVAVGHIHFIEE